MLTVLTTLLQVDGHPVKGWDEKALLAHVMGEEGEQQQFEREYFVAEPAPSAAAVETALMRCAHRHVLQH